MTRTTRLFTALAVVAGARPLAAAEPEAYQVEFEAGRVELDTATDELEMSEDVVVRVDRYRLTSERLRLKRGPRGVEVDGSGKLAFCPCPDPPVTLGFSGATIAPPTDVIIEQPTVRVGDVPVLWLPWLWLRASDRLGLLPPRIAWRGEDGLFAGGGIHAPFGSRERPVSLDLAAGGYFEGGADVEGRLRTSDTTTAVRWDHLDRSLLAIDARGAALTRDGGGAAWHVDAVRGARGRRATLSLEQAARRFDRAELAIGATHEAFFGALGARLDAERGGAMDELGTVGPRAHAGVGTAIGEAGSADLALDLGTTRDPDLGSQSDLVQIGELALDARPGPVAFGVEVGERVDATSAEEGSGAAIAAGARSVASVPLLRDFGPVRHWVEPFTEAAAAVTASRGELAQESLLDAPAEQILVTLQAGMRTALGTWTRRTGADLTLRGGFAGEAEALEPLAALRLAMRADVLGASSEAAYGLDDRSFLTLSRLRLGPEHGLHISGYAEGRLDAEPAPARFFVSPAWRAQRGGWLDRQGWTLGGALAVPWADWLATRVAADYHLEQERLLAVRGGLGYRHRCGCLAASAWAGQRIGRDGFEVWGTLDLLP